MAIYFVREPATRTIKIGFAENPFRRFVALQTACPYELTLIGVIPGGRAGEAELHRRFKKYRVRGEWFRDAPELLSALYDLLQLNVAVECGRRGGCRTGLKGLLMRHEPTDHDFECKATLWGAGRELLVVPPGSYWLPGHEPKPTIFPGGVKLFHGRDYDMTKFVSVKPYPASECVLLEDWPVTCCEPD